MVIAACLFLTLLGAINCRKVTEHLTEHWRSPIWACEHVQNIIVELPYQFIPPRRSDWFAKVLLYSVRIQSLYNRFAEGVVSHECRHVERLRESLSARHGILIAPNHSRTSDAGAIGWLCEAVPCLVYGMASWHLFHQGWLSHWILRAVGAFSVNREGVDREAITAAIEILEAGERPLVIFPEGATSRTNERLTPLLEGVACIARAAARRRSRTGKKVVVHPIAIKYHLLGGLECAVERTLNDLERRLFWRTQRNLPLPERVCRIANALLTIKEIEYLGESSQDSLARRLDRLIEHLLAPVEQEWVGRRQSGPTIRRVRVLRPLILAEMVTHSISGQERQRRWRQLEDLYLAQQLSNYVPDYFSVPKVDRIFELVEKLEEDLTDKVRNHPPLHCVIDVGHAIEVSPLRIRNVALDPLIADLQHQIQGMLDKLAENDICTISSHRIDHQTRRSAAPVRGVSAT